ncbi:hypothetical protein Lal_00028447 [Lupinus albus]|nr:hypothetical protein Lal_00028447 [Lupinus albus]
MSEARESHRISEMWVVFSKWGSVGDVIIPQKRDNSGNKFGFVRFKQVEEDEKLLKALEQVWIGNYKIKINSSRFKRKADRNYRRVPPSRNKTLSPGFHSKVVDKDGKHLSWKEALLKENPPSFPATTTKTKILHYNVSDELMASLSNEWVGELLRWEGVHTLQETLNREGLLLVKTTHLGGKLFLLKSEVKENIRQFFSDEEQWWKTIFKDIKKWNPMIRSLEKLVWIHRLGEFIRIDDATKNMERLDLARCLVTTSSMNHIDLTQKILIGDVEWEIRVVKEGSLEACHHCNKVRMEREDITVSTSIDSKDGEWWPDGVNGDLEAASLVGDDDDVAKGLGKLYMGQSVLLGGSKKEKDEAEKIRPLACAIDVNSEKKEDGNTKMDSLNCGDGKVVGTLWLKEIEIFNRGEEEVAV